MKRLERIRQLPWPARVLFALSAFWGAWSLLFTPILAGALDWSLVDLYALLTPAFLLVAIAYALFQHSRWVLLPLLLLPASIVALAVFAEPEKYGSAAGSYFSILFASVPLAGKVIFVVSLVSAFYAGRLVRAGRLR